MAVEIKSLTSGVPPEDMSLEATNDSFNVLEQKDKVYDLYVVPEQRAAVVKSIRLVNVHATATVKVSLWFNRPDNDRHRRRRLTPAWMPLPANFVYVDDSELTLEAGDKIQAQADTDQAIQYLISGAERDMT